MENEYYEKDGILEDAVEEMIFEIGWEDDERQLITIFAGV